MEETRDIKIKLSGISKSFPGVKALDDIHLEVRTGQVHALVGENGAGKSTMMKIINGSYRPDAGTIELDGREIEIKNPLHSTELGIAMIYQELHFMPNFTVAEYLFLAKEPVKIKGIVDWKKMRSEADKVLKDEGVTFTSSSKMCDMSISEIQLLEILKAVYSGASLIIMDEPTSSISNKEVTRLFEYINELRNKGITIIYISHKLDEVLEIADMITVLRDGQVIDTRTVDQYDKDTMISQMVGRQLENVFPPRGPWNIGNILLKVDGLCGAARFQDVCFEIKAGEIVGFAGLVGAGRTEVMRSIAGLDPYYKGTISIEGRQVNISSVLQSNKQGILMATEDRKRFGVVMQRSIKENITLQNLRLLSFFNWIMNNQMEKTEVTKKFEELNIKAPGIETEVETLSGGNQQKVVLAKLLLATPKVLILDEPTRGIDVGAKYEIYKKMNAIAETGVGIIMISSELPEIIGMCNRVYIMRERQLVAMVEGEDINQETIMRIATGG